MEEFSGRIGLAKKEKVVNAGILEYVKKMTCLVVLLQFV